MQFIASKSRNQKFYSGEKMGKVRYDSEAMINWPTDPQQFRMMCRWSRETYAKDYKRSLRALRKALRMSPGLKRHAFIKPHAISPWGEECFEFYVRNKVGDMGRFWALYNRFCGKEE